LSTSPDPVRKDSRVEEFIIVKHTFCFNSQLSSQSSGWLSLAAAIKVLSLRGISHHYHSTTT
jgi:hypothetical protein